MRDRKIKPRDKRFIVVRLTRTPSLPYSTPRAPNSRVLFTMSTSSLMAEKTLHTKNHTTLGHTLITPYTHLLTHLLHTYLLHTFLVHNYLHNYLHTCLLHYFLVHDYFHNFLLHTYLLHTLLFTQLSSTHLPTSQLCTYNNVLHN